MSTTTTTTTTTTKEKKATKIQRFQDISNILNNKPVKYGTTIDIATAFIAHEVELLEKKNTTGKQAEKKAVDGSYKNLILDCLENLDMEESSNKDGLTCSDIWKLIPELADLSNQKVAALVRALEKDKLLVRTVIKGRAYFKVNG